MYDWDNQEIQKQKSVKWKYGMGNKANPKIEEQNLRKGNMVEIIGQIHVRPSRHSNNGTRPQTFYIRWGSSEDDDENPEKMYFQIKISEHYEMMTRPRWEGAGNHVFTQFAD